jgi:opacity protein-like surface antigen
MKRLISTACFALVASSALAADPALPVEEVVARTVSGYGQIYAGGVWVDFDGESESFWAAGGTGQINIPFADTWNVQGGLNLDAIGQDGDTLYGYGGEAHLFWRDPASYAFGGFGEIKSYDFSGGGMGEDDTWDWKIGPEAQVYFDRVTLYAQAYYGQFEIDLAPVDIEQWGIRGVVRYFAQDNLRFDAEAGFHRISIDEVDQEADTVSLALQAMYRFTDTPISVFGRYQFDSTDFGGLDADFHKAIVGLRFSFGSSTLIDEDRNGATMDTWRPNFIQPL